MKYDLKTGVEVSEKEFHGQGMKESFEAQSITVKAIQKFSTGCFDFVFI
jgi:hypothetical protein